MGKTDDSNRSFRLSSERVKVRQSAVKVQAGPKPTRRLVKSDGTQTCSQEQKKGQPKLKQILTSHAPPTKKYGRKGPPLLSCNTKLLDRFLLLEMIGGGGFGQIYRAFDEVHHRHVAVKVEPQNHDPGRMVLELDVLSHLRGTPNTPTVYAAGKYEQVHFIIMEILGPNLSDLRKQQPGNSLSVNCSLRVTMQASTGLRTLHDFGFVHRDVKPSNFCIGLTGASRRIIYIVDFGLSRRFRFEDGQIRRQRRRASFRGTLKYVSLNVHRKQEQGPVDDFISLFYTAFELAEGALPWRALKDPLMVEQSKRTFRFTEHAKCLPYNFKQFYEYLETLTYKDELNYEFLQLVIRNCLSGNINDQTPYDWEIPVPANV